MNESHQLRWWDVGTGARKAICRLNMNDPPTELVRFRMARMRGGGLVAQGPADHSCALDTILAALSRSRVTARCTRSRSKNKSSVQSITTLNLFSSCGMRIK